MASHGTPLDLGEMLTLWSVLPFAGMLLSIALFPLFAPRFWHHHFGKISAFWSVVIALPLLFLYRGAALHEFLHIMIADYVPFMLLLAALYTVSGGILIRGTLRGTPLVNTTMLATGTMLASWMGTTGAAMLLIRPFLKANANRKNRTFMIVFFIFLVANVGGSLTPLGDPPLFLGFLRGVPFFWTFNLLLPMVIVAGLLLLFYFFMDRHFYRKETGGGLPAHDGTVPFAIVGSYNVILIAAIVGAVLMSGVVHWGEVSLFGIHRSVQDMVRDAMLVLILVLSLIITPREVREENFFTWFPIKEVAILFAGIFLTMMPCLAILQAGEDGSLAFIVGALQEPSHYFWLTGILSSFLDNAPTYLTFLNTALGGLCPNVPGSQAVSVLIQEHAVYLLAISAGAVFFGAFTYIGNAPNFMVRSIAEEAGTRMPSFFGYMLKYAIPILIPLFLLITVLFFLS